MSITPYEALGGEEAVRQLVERFYEHMDEDAEALTIRRMHPEDLARAQQRLFEFLSGWLGGPNLYWERHGHPRLRMRHLPFAIDAAARDAWMGCMRKALAETVADDTLRAQLDQALTNVANHMRNQNEADEG
ncbi:MAG: group II truncated hemoglobin [Deltaproteobacteria bacterium]|nr:group II truncated hemoglobin [Deltaproteobacteria bacterium]